MTQPAVDDPVVRAAVQLLPVPEHREGFWAHLHAVLEAEAIVEPAPTVARVREPVPPAPPALLPPALRRPSSAVLAAVAAAAVVVVAVASQSLLSGRTTSGTARRAAATSELETLVDRAQPPDSTPAPLTSEQEGAASDAVLAWTQAVGAGETDGAWAALGPASQAHFASAAAFEAELARVAEAFAPWASGQPSQILVTPVADDDAGTLAVVTLVGADAAEAVPVRLTDGGAEVEPFATLPGLELVTPEAPVDDDVAAPMAIDDELLVVVPAGVDAPLLRLDDGAVVVCGEADGSELTTLDDGSAKRCAYLPPDGIDPGRHTLTVAFRGADGASVGARSVLFDAA